MMAFRIKMRFGRLIDVKFASSPCGSVAGNGLCRVTGVQNKMILAQSSLLSTCLNNYAVFWRFLFSWSSSRKCS